LDIGSLGHRLDHFLTDTLGKYVEYVPVCPEFECGLGVPREPMRLVGDAAAPRLVTTRTQRDLTDGMVRWARRRVGELEKEDLCGFIFKSGSPSSGLHNVRIYDSNGVPARKGVGLFARMFTERFPLLPVEDEGRLHDERIRENFIEQLFTLIRWRAAARKGKRPRNLVDFHTDHKLLLMSHSPKHATAMGKLVAQAKSISADTLYERYLALLMEALRLKTTPKKNTNVLQHIMGYFKKVIPGDEKQELLDVIDRYRNELLPLVVPVTLINHFVRTFNQPYLQRQYYLNPHPIELQLRNHV